MRRGNFGQGRTPSPAPYWQPNPSLSVCFEVALLSLPHLGIISEELVLVPNFDHQDSSWVLRLEIPNLGTAAQKAERQTVV